MASGSHERSGSSSGYAAGGGVEIGTGSILAHHTPPASKPTAPSTITMGTKR